MKDFAIVLAAGIVVTFAGLNGCGGTSTSNTAAAYHDAAVRCAHDQDVVYETCMADHTPAAECRAKLAPVRAACHAELENLCKHGRGCP